MGKILVVDDDLTLCSMLTTRLQSSGYESESAASLKKGVELASGGEYDIVLLDVQLPDGNGLDHIPDFTSVDSRPEIIIMTGNGDPNGAKKAITSGAWDYLVKPHVLRDLLLPVTRALQYRKEKFKHPSVSVALKRDGIVGQSKTIEKCLNKVAQAANSDASILITGETGTGKEMFAHAIHLNSQRARGKFIIVDCATLPENLVESILFGHVKGSFTGADIDTHGLICQANEGTLFLDEVGELPFDIQKKLLRVLQERRYRAVGGIQERSSDFRLIAATNKNLDKLVEKREFRSDLLYRLRSLSISLPPLRERKGDIPLLAHHILKKAFVKKNIEEKVVSLELISCLEAYSWPGNVRELQGVLEEVIAGTVGYEKLFALHLPDHIRVCGSQANLDRADENFAPRQVAKQQPIPWRQFKTQVEMEYVERLMDYAEGNVKMACEVSGLSRARLYQLLKR